MRPLIALLCAIISMGCTGVAGDMSEGRGDAVGGGAASGPVGGGDAAGGGGPAGGGGAGGGGGAAVGGGVASGGGAAGVDAGGFPTNPLLPTLVAGRWVELTPPTVTTGAPETCIGQGVAVDPRTPSTLYWGNTPYTDALGGLFKTTDSGATWRRVARVTPAYPGASDHLDMPLHVRIDPNDSTHLYAGDGVRGSSQGFFISHDSGEHFEKPAGWTAARTAAGIDNEDVYDIAVDPVNFDHVLVSFHYRWGWTETKWNRNSGLMESFDGGLTWRVHAPIDGWGSGHSIKFLFEPSLGIGSASTWLLGTQGNGFWRTTDSGANWAKVSNVDISHGGSTHYYTRTGVLYTGGVNTLRSTDNGATWSVAWPGSSWGIHGDGERLYTGRVFGANQPLVTSAETDGTTWVAQNSQRFLDGPYEMAFDRGNRILYASSWSSGLWALLLPK